MTKPKKGLIQIYTGDGKGKTTAALGLALRATSHKFKVAFIQFVKFNHDEPALKQIPDLHFKSFGFDHETTHWLHKLKKDEKLTPEYKNYLNKNTQITQKAWAYAQKIINQGKYDIVILDELNIALYFDLLKIQDIVNTLTNKPQHVEIVITGRKANPKLISIANLVSEIKEIKHPFQKGIPARKGIDY